MSDLVWTLHTVSGAVGRVPRHVLEHEHFGQYLVEVDPNTKPYESHLWKPTTADEYRAARHIEPSAPDADAEPENED